MLDDVDAVLVVGSREQLATATAWPRSPPSTASRTYPDRRAGRHRPTWFRGDEVVAVTAGASAPEDLVEGCLDLLCRTFGAHVEERSTREEHVFFPLPLELRPALPESV